MNTNFVYHEQHQYEHGHSIANTLHAEELYFADYDYVMTLEANSFEQQHNQAFFDDNHDGDNNNDGDEQILLDADEYNDGDHQEEDLIAMGMETGYNYQDDALLKLIVDVQSYLCETNAGVDRNESPLVGLQYKMYTYLKQRVNDMGIDINTLV
ncbi:hypothetical protein BCR42DRAFT_420037 [Absidia repens]|uniref:Uncharacterized protein n=1 Tax=Absidia repens TaxID=90262 RepID=A0A1X2IAN9_9FUNG|nr:hypothetical protein BCR42DRAFT_420037 [Absidia repens]